jgi:hypothetical protein
MVTVKLPYYTPDKLTIKALMKNQASVTKFIFNRLKDSDGKIIQKELTKLANSMNNISVDSWFKQSSIYEAGAVFSSYKNKLKEILNYNKNNPGTLKKPPTVIFGSRKTFLERCKNKISRNDFIENKLLPLVSVGEALQRGNRKFQFKVIEENKIVFKPELGVKITLQLPKLRKNYQKILYKLQTLSEQKKIPVKISLDLNFIYFTYDEYFIKNFDYVPVKNRVMAIDMNPNYVGYSILDYENSESNKVLKTGILSIKKLNDKHFSFKKEKISSNNPKNIKLNNQRRFEIFEISKTLSNIAQANNVECFGFEDLNMHVSNKGKGKKYNRLVNNLWCRKNLSNNLKKRLIVSGIKVIEVPAAYSSFVGNLLFRQFPDMVASSIEINRRTYLFLNNEKIALFPSFSGSISALTQSLEELGLEASKLILKAKGWKDLYGKIKNLKLRYRVSLDRFWFKVFRLDHSPWTESFLFFSMI